ncbi:ABC transporter substrate-binding protein [Stutzerimonas stutzeri]|uniref:SsuA/THI5-like domain-containing protein n=1 Tax=Stutzerimonas stutzeri KOS6 TaxID=1218352 RepID=A0A061JJJ1_STUST|nr:ABC transporter substrate-binding protein [Stutzerimonas stutzeri]EWC39331.1 hypothetical protein B597_020855 [Stutzerimonas stutzeri KOS6]
MPSDIRHDRRRLLAALGLSCAGLLLPGRAAALQRTPQAADRLVVAIVSQTFFYVPLWLGLQRGAFRRAGIELEIVQLGHASQVEPLLSGQVHVAIATPESILQNVAAGGPLRLVAGNTGKLAHTLIARPALDSIEALRGGRIGILNRREGTFFQVREMLARHGLQYPGDYSVVQTGGVPARHRALLEGTIDAGLQSVPWSYQAEEEGLRNLGEIIDYIPDWQFVSVNASLPWAERNRELLERFLAVLLESTEALYANREEAAEVASRQLPTRRDYALRAWDYYTGSNALTRDMSVSHAGLSTVLDIQRSNGLLDAQASMRVEDYQAPEFLAAARRYL